MSLKDDSNHFSENVRQPEQYDVFFFPPVSPHGHLFDVTHCAKQEWKLVRCKERQQDKKIEKASL